jgi:enamine deaminase RidA (YjgF/YER057c/UK114 family)
VKVNRWYVGRGTVADFEPAALACAAHFSEPGPAATGIPIPRHAADGQQIKIEAVAMLGEDGRRLPRRHSWPETLWDWHVHLPYKHGLKCADMIFLGGQVSLDKQGHAVRPGDLTAQTQQAMTHIGTILRDLGADYQDVCKVTTMYEGSCGAADLHRNLSIRSSFFAEPGPATTGIPLPKLAYPDMVIEIDVFAMAEPD